MGGRRTRSGGRSRNKNPFPACPPNTHARARKWEGTVGGGGEGASVPSKRELSFYGRGLYATHSAGVLPLPAGDRAILIALIAKIINTRARAL